MDSVLNRYTASPKGRAPGARRAAIVVAALGLMLWTCDTCAWLVHPFKPAR